MIKNSDEKPISHDDGGYCAYDIGEEGVTGGITSLGDTDRAEIDGEDIESGVGGAADAGCEFADESISTVGLHYVEHHGTTATTAQRLHKHGGESPYPLRVEAHPADETLHPAGEYVERPLSTEHADSHQDSH